jgi:hypothetical protein
LHFSTNVEIAKADDVWCADRQHSSYAVSADDSASLGWWSSSCAWPGSVSYEPPRLVRRTQKVKGLHVLLGQLYAAQAVIHGLLPQAELEAGIGTVRVEDGVVGVLLDGLRVEGDGLVVLAGLELGVSALLELLGEVGGHEEIGE